MNILERLIAPTIAFYMKKQDWLMILTQISACLRNFNKTCGETQKNLSMSSSRGPLINAYSLAVTTPRQHCGGANLITERL